MERTLVLIKPDAMIRGVAFEALSRIEKTGLKIVGLKMIMLNDEILDEHYAHLKDKPFFNGIKEFMKSSPVIAAVFEGVNAVEKVRKIAGATRPWEANAGTIRGDMATGLPGNIIHASDSVETAKAEIRRFFGDDEIFEWERPTESLFTRD